MTLKEFAVMLNERQYSGFPWTDEELRIAEANHFVIVSGYSDDLVEIRGAINATVHCFKGGKIFLLKDGSTITEEEFHSLNDKEKVIQFKAKWWEEKDEYEDFFEWTYDVPFPHEKIKLYCKDYYKGGSLFCVGFVFELQE